MPDGHEEKSLLRRRWRQGKNGNFIKFIVLSIVFTVLPLLTFSFKASELYLSGVVIIVLGLGEMVSQRGKADFTVKFHFYLSVLLIVYGSFLYGGFKGAEATSNAETPAAQHAQAGSAADTDAISIATIPPLAFLIIAIVLGSSAAYFSSPPPGQDFATALEGDDQK